MRRGVLLFVLYFGLCCSAAPPVSPGLPGPTEARDSLRVAAMAQGYWSAAADSSGLFWGPLFLIRHVAVRDEDGYPLDGLALRGYSGSVASRKNLTALQQEVRAFLLDHGFPFAVLHCQARPDSLGHPAVDVLVHVRRGDAYKFGGLTLYGGSTHMQPETVRRLSLLEIGEPYDQRRLEEALQRLRRTGYFETADWVGLYRDSTRNLLYPALALVESHQNQLGGLLGYDSKAAANQDLTGYLDIHLVNILGTARDFDFTFDSRPDQEREAHLAYVEPWPLGLPVGVRLELDFLQQDTTYWEWNRRAVFFKDLGFKSRLEIRVGNQENQDAVADQHTEAWQSGLALGFDNRDRAAFTTSGSHAEIGVTGMRRDTQDSSYYLVQSTGAVEAWFPFPHRLGLKFGASAATNFPLAGRFNLGELYYVGGARLLRGYSEHEFLTNAYVVGEAEAQYGLGRKGRVFLFTDPGLVNRLVGDYYWRQVLGYGVGIELSKGGDKGEWSVAVTYALNPDRGPGDGLIHLGVDNRF